MVSSTPHYQAGAVDKQQYAKIRAAILAYPPELRAIMFQILIKIMLECTVDAEELPLAVVADTVGGCVRIACPIPLNALTISAADARNIAEQMQRAAQIVESVNEGAPVH